MKNSLSMFFKPHPMDHDSAWLGHIPFAHWLVDLVKPSCIVELGVHYGHSYFAFCHSVKKNKLETTCYGIDTWAGDNHAGHYEEGVYKYVENENMSHFNNFSKLLRTTFDEALATFSDKSIDILHIDGLHTYEAVNHDFNSWLPKLSDQGIVLFHDISVHRDNFGVWKLWKELTEQYQHLDFHHSSGLGVLFVGGQLPDDLKNWVDELSFDDNRNFYRNLFAKLGFSLQAKVDIEEIGQLANKLQEQEHKVAILETEIRLIRNSFSWKLTSPLRFIKTHINKLLKQER